MTRISPIQYDYVRYILIIDGRQDVIPEPANWRTSERGFYRNTQYHGVIITVSDAIEFTGLTAQRLNTIYDRDGVLAKVEIIERMSNEYDETYVDLFRGILDFSTAERTQDSFYCKINSNEMTKKLQSRWRTEVSIENTIDLDGNEIEPLTEWINVFMSDRGLKGENQLSTGTRYNHEIQFFMIPPGQDVKTTPLMTKLGETWYNLETVKAIDSTIYKTAGSMFFVNNTKNELLCNTSIVFNGNIVGTDYPESSANRVILELNIWDIGDNGTEISYTLADTIELFRYDNPKHNQLFLYNNSLLVSVGTTQCVSLNLSYRLTGPVAKGFFNIEECSLNIWANTEFTSTNCRALLPYDIFARIIRLMGGKNLDSKFLSKLRLAVTNGFNIRNVPDKGDITYTFQKLFDSYSAIYPLGLEVNGNTIKIENLEYFYQKFIAIDFGDNIIDVKFTHYSELGFSEINIGFETSNYEDGALDEYNVRTVWATPVNIYRQVLNMVSSIQASSYVIETLRRVQYSSNAERTFERRGDTTVFFLDLKDDVNELRKWNDDFDELPQNILYPENAYNLRLSPMNRLRVFGNWVGYGLMKFRNLALTFASSTGKTKMITKPKGKEPKAENDSIKISELGYARFTNEKVTFKVRPIEIISVINEKVNGVPKVYGLFKFKFKDTAYQGYLLSYKPESNEVELILES